jgi:hypothetical protein
MALFESSSGTRYTFAEARDCSELRETQTKHGFSRSPAFAGALVLPPNLWAFLWDQGGFARG